MTLASPSTDDFLALHDWANDSTTCAKRKELGQYDTPCFAAEALYDSRFSDLGPQDVVAELCCGTGNMLGAIPAHVGAFGCEIDPARAAIAAERTGRKVFVGDFRDIALPSGVTAIFTNPPFNTTVIDDLLAKARDILPDRGRCGLLLPAYATQTSHRVVRWNQHWTIEQEAIPRDLFPSLSRPLVFCLFQKDEKPRLIGLRLYRETSEVRSLAPGFQRLLIDGSRGVRTTWLGLVRAVLKARGGKATLDQLYAGLLGRAPDSNRFPKAKIRQTCYRHLTQDATGAWFEAEKVAA